MLRWLKFAPRGRGYRIPDTREFGKPFRKGRDMKRLAILTVVANLAMAGAAGAAEVDVRLLNKGTDGGTTAIPSPTPIQRIRIRYIMEYLYL
jgi:hypothetical protein